MALTGYRSLVLAAFGVLILTLTSVFGGDGAPTWAAHTTLLKRYQVAAQGYRDELKYLSDRKKDLYGMDRSPASNGTNPADAVAAVNLEILAAEAKLQKLLKKSDYLLAAKRELTDEETLKKASRELKRDIQQTEHDLKQITDKIEKLAKACKDCKLTPLVPDRELASKNKQQKEYHELSHQRAQLEDRLDNYRLREEALRDLHAIAENRDTEEPIGPASQRGGIDSRR